MLPFPVRVRNLLRKVIASANLAIIRRFWGMDIGEGSFVSLKALLDKSNPHGIHIGRNTGVSFRAVILAHDFLHNRHVDTWIGDRCQIGACSIIYPGVRIGDGCIVAAGSVVTRDIPENCLVAGNPARIVEKGILTGKFGIRIDAIPEERLDQRMVVD